MCRASEGDIAKQFRMSKHLESMSLGTRHVIIKACLFIILWSVAQLHIHVQHLLTDITCAINVAGIPQACLQRLTSTYNAIRLFSDEQDLFTSCTHAEQRPSEDT